MTYNEYLAFYHLKCNDQTYEDWLVNENFHGRAYEYKGGYYSTETGEMIGFIGGLR